MTSFEYTTSYFPLPYEVEQRGMLGRMVKGEAYPEAPDPAAFIRNEKYQAHLGSMGADGWELVNVQTALRGVHVGLNKESGLAVNYTVTAGYFLFWKKPLTPALTASDRSPDSARSFP